MPLTEVGAKNAKPRYRDYKLSDEKGLYLLIKQNGAKYWRVKYRFARKEKTLALGVYPEISLKQARQERDEARLQLAKGIDPSQLKQSRKSQLIETQKHSFQSVALEWFAASQARWTDTTTAKQLWILESCLFPWLGTLPIRELKPPQILKALRKTESRGAIETAHRAKQVAGQVFRYAVAAGIIDSDPTRDLKGALATKKANHLAALTDPKAVGELLRAIDGYEGTHIVRTLLAITPLLFQRPGEIRQMEWEEIDFDHKQWEIPAHKMKMGEPHIVPLSRQAISLLKDIQPITGWGSYVFSNERNRRTPASDGTVNKALRNLGYTKHQMTAHGFRAMARTLLDEVLEYPAYLIEQQISHAVKDPLCRAYNRTAHLSQRKQMMQAWADYLYKIKQGENTIFIEKLTPS